MTTEKLLETPELEDYCLLNDYSIVYNRWTDAVVLSKEGHDYQFKEEYSDADILAAVEGFPEGNPLADYLDKVEYPEDELQ